VASRRPRCLFALALVACALSLAPSAAAAVSFERSFLVSSAVFTLDGSGGVFTARDGAVDHYDAGGNPTPGFAVPSLFTAPNDMVRVGSRLYAVDAGSNKLHRFNTDGSGQLISVDATDNRINTARTLAVAGNLVYVGTGETRSVARLSIFPVFGEFLLKFGWGVADGSQAFQVCGSPNPCSLAGFSGPELGKVNDARGIALDSAGNIYVAERASPDSRIEVYNSSPAPVGAIGSEGSAAGRVNQPFGLALDGAGNLFVADHFNHRVDQFRTDGTFVQAFGFGVSTGAEAFETCTTTCKQGIAGSSPGQLKFPLEVDYDGAGRLYVSDLGFPPRVSVFGVDGGGGGVTRTLTVTTSGAGSGTVTGAGIDCGGAGHTDCSETVTDGTAVALTATAAAGSKFGGYTGGGCGAASTCTVTMNADHSVSAAFVLPPSNAFSIGRTRLGLLTGGATITLRVPGPGVLKALATARVPAAAARAARRFRVARARVAAAKAGRVALRLRPSRKAKQILRKKGRLRVRVRITFRPTGGALRARTTTVTLKLRQRR
jgi:Divergent InlB B-repeat domain